MRILSLFSLLAIGAALVAGGCGSSSSSGSGSARQLVPTNVVLGSLANIGGVAYFLRTEFETGVEPWISDGTLSGTRRIMDIYQGPLKLSVETPNFTEFAGSVYFFFDDGIHGDELWRTDGSEEGTALFQDLLPGPDSFTPRSIAASQERLYVLSFPESSGGQLWVIEASP